MSQDKRGPYQKGVELRARAVQVAVRLFSENGFHATSMREIASELDMSHTGLKHHFGSKEELLTAVLQHRDDIDSVALDADMASGADHLTALLHLVQRNAERRSIVELFTTLAAEATTPGHPAHKYFTERYDFTTSSLGDVFVQLQKAGRLRPHVDARRAARLMIAAMDGLQVQWLYRTADAVDDARGDMIADLRGFLDLVLEDDPAL